MNETPSLHEQARKMDAKLAQERQQAEVYRVQLGKECHARSVAEGDLARVREALERISQPNQDALREACKTGDVMRILQQTLTMLNKGRDEAQVALYHAHERQRLEHLEDDYTPHDEGDK